MKSKNLLRRISAFVLSLMLVTCALAISAGAANAFAVTAELRPNVTIIVDGEERTFYNAQGQEVHAIFYNGTHHLSVRAIGELMGKNVNWDQDTQTVSLAGTRTIGVVTGTPDGAAHSKSISVQVRPDFTIVVDNVVRKFVDAKGNAVYPILYQGTTYLPVRALGELMGKEVAWNSQQKIITLSTPGTADGLVTDADSFHQTGPVIAGSGTSTSSTAQTQSGTMLAVEDAKGKALAHAGYTSGQVTFVKQKLDWENGRQVFEIEFYTTDYKKYDYEIDAYTGKVISFDYDAESYQRSGNAASNGGNGNYIGEEKAKSIALQAAGITFSQAKQLRCHLERDDGRWEYNVEFYSGTVEYEYEIDAFTGRILSQDVDSIYD